MSCEEWAAEFNNTIILAWAISLGIRSALDSNLFLMARVIPLKSSRVIIKFSSLYSGREVCNRTELTWVENRVFINDDNLVSRHSQDNYSEKLTQYFHFWDLALCRVKSDPCSRDLAVSVHKELTVTLLEILDGGRWKKFQSRKHSFINFHKHGKDDELLLFSNILQKCYWWVKSVEYLLHNISSKLDSISLTHTGPWRLSSDSLLTTLARAEINMKRSIRVIRECQWLLYGDTQCTEIRLSVKIVSWLSNNLLEIRTVIWCGSTDSRNKNWLDLSGCQNEGDIAGNE